MQLRDKDTLIDELKGQIIWLQREKKTLELNQEFNHQCQLPPKVIQRANEAASAVNALEETKEKVFEKSTETVKKIEGNSECKNN